MCLTMENKTYIYEPDKRTRRLGMLYIVLVVAVFAILFIAVRGAYLSAWFLSIICAVLALAAMSIPRKITLTDRSLNINCVVELTSLPLEDIRGVRRVDKSDMPKCMPVFGCYGFFGYYGYFLNFRTWNLFKIYASEWDNFVEIEDIYESRLVVSCSDPDRFVSDVIEARDEFFRNTSANTPIE